MTIINPNRSRVVANAFGLSDIGLKRKKNEDSFLVDHQAGLFIVADGMGGLSKGDYASSYASQRLNSLIKLLRHPEDVTLTDDEIDHSSEDPIKNLLYGIIEVNAALYEESKKLKKEDPTSKGMGTTIALLYVRYNQAIVLNVGDSRVYRIHENTIQQITHDHSVVEEQKRWGEVTPEEALQMKKNVLRRSIGTKEEVQPDPYILTIYPPERFLLCTDGLYNELENNEILQFSNMPNLKQACEKMIELAKERGAKDNVTAVLVEISSISGKSPSENFEMDKEKTFSD